MTNQTVWEEPEDDRSERIENGVHGACVWPIYMGIVWLFTGVTIVMWRMLK